MPLEITLPQLGESVTEGQIVRWLKAPGERVARFEPLVEVLTDKVTVQVPSPAEGVLVAIRVGEGETVPVGTVLALLEVEGGTARPGAPEPGLAAGKGLAEDAGSGPTQRDDGSPADRGLYSPAVRRLAREHGIDLSRVKGTGEGGRVTRDDVLRAVQEKQRGLAAEAATPTPARWDPTPASAASSASTASPAAPADAAAPGPAPEAARAVAAAAGPSSAAEYVEVPPSAVRAVIARRMVESWTTIPHAWTMVEADVTALVALREQLHESFYRREGFELTFLPFAIRAVAEALREFPQLNASWVDGRIRQHRRIHIGVAVGLEEGLLVPVIRDADQLSVVGIARLLHGLVGRARAGKLSPDELQGATFTVNNTGALGSVLSAPIISPPQGAILTTEAVTKRLVVLKDDQLAIRALMNLCLSFDHRLCDGVHALRFLQAVRRRLEAYGPGTPLA